ncbi:TRAP transporter fused permease subunit [Georhizobium profundi]|jgi:TRAP transporter 4TM/12TM fusion protein|uniref:TRAP transporter fused permease subunit n=1 Tax=Georhizobium profundi TaxID=2341112 RepID=A0A3Q8XRH3_9HYPH|nr:TRAP transporter fused permease subunit [Georhizobium profundi]AZN73334.1 TRAP transporter fused permease subunit [Georhizobium profundi]
MGKRITTLVGNVLTGGDSVPLNPVTRTIATALALPLAIFQFWLAFVGIVTPIQLGLFFMIPMLIVACLTTSGVTGVQKTGWFEIVMAVSVALAGGYLMIESPRLGTWMLGISEFSMIELVAGAILIFVTLVMVKRRVGLGMLAVVLILMGYLAFGHLLSGFLYHREFTPADIIEQSIISVNGGLFGTPVAAAAVYVYLFVVFGKILQTSGGGQFFFDVAAIVAGRRVGGVAKVGVVSSGLFGMISGSPTSDVVTTGTITIPMMKRLGYPAHIAAAIETVACVGGSFLPPVMGAVVFILVEFTGIPYGDVVKASIAIALIYYFTLYLQVHHFSAKHGFGQIDEDKIPTFFKVMRTGWVYVLPMIVLVYLIESGFTPQYSVAIAIAGTVVLSWFNPERDYRLGPVRLVNLVTDAAVMMAPLVAAVAAAGLVEQVLNVTGLGSKISYEMFEMAGGMPILILILAALVTIIFGMGMPVPAVYALAAILLAPGLIQAGFGVLQAHLFLVWFAVASHLTPPVAVCAYVAATIAEAPPMKTSVTASRLGIVVFLIPFAFMLRPGLIMQADVATIVVDLLMTTAAMFTLAAASMGYFTSSIAGWLRVVLMVLAAVALFGVAVPVVSAVAAVLSLAVLGWHYFAKAGRVSSRDSLPSAAE